MGNADEFDINLIATPGIFYQHHSYVAQLTIDMCEARGDCFYIMDNVVFPKSNQSTGLIDAAINVAATIDSSYAATYYPWVKILDTNLNKIVSVPPSVVLPAIYAANDKASAEWFAPAGFNRAALNFVSLTRTRVNQTEREKLYAVRVNPVVKFPNEGYVIFAQKTLDGAQTSLDSINVQRMVMDVQRQVIDIGNRLIWQQLTPALYQEFVSKVSPVLALVQSRGGLRQYKVVCDETNNTALDRENNRMKDRKSVV